MSLLTSKLPDSVRVCGKDYPVRTDFRTWLHFEELMLEEKTRGSERMVRLYDLCFTGERPSAPRSALSALCRFFSGRADEGTETEEKPKEGRKSASHTLDFSFDAGLIYAAFREVYGIDLLSEQNADLHWHVFLALLRALPDECRLCRVMSLRAMKLSDISDPDARRRYAELKEACALPDKRSEEEKQKALDDTVAQGFFA